MVVPFYRRTSEKQQLSKNHTSMSETKIELGRERSQQSQGSPLSLHLLLLHVAHRKDPAPSLSKRWAQDPVWCLLGHYLMMEGVFDTPIPSVDG